MLRAQSGPRFTLLLLEEGEDYIADYNAYCRAPAWLWTRSQDGAATQQSNSSSRQARVHGKLRLCTKSVFFDSDDAAVPIVRYEGQPDHVRICCTPNLMHRYDCEQPQRV